MPHRTPGCRGQLRSCGGKDPCACAYSYESERILPVLRLLDKRLLFVTGKGGVGKTTVATALGLAAARRGLRTIVCEVSQQERMPQVFRREGVGYSETELAPNLFGMSVDPQLALEEYLIDQTGSARLGSLLAGNRIFEYFVAAAPGVRELATIGKLWELAQPTRRNPQASPYDLVIVDAPATGHGLGLLKTPKTYRDVARVGPIRRQAGHIRDFLGDPDRTAVVAVAIAQDGPVTETLELAAELGNELDMPVQATIANQLLPERFTGEEAKQIAAIAERNGSVRAAGALQAALSEHRRARSQQTQLRRLRRELRDVIGLPFVWEGELDLDAF